MFQTLEKELVVITTISSWDEPPRIRHQVALELSKNYNVLFVQLNKKICKSGSRNSSCTSLTIASAGVDFKGLGRLFRSMPALEEIYLKRMASNIEKKVKNLGYKTAKLVNFQYNFPEIYERSIFNKKIFIYNDDFINIQNGISDEYRNYLREKQNRVILNSDANFGVGHILTNDLRKIDASAQLLLPGVSFVENEKASQPPSNSSGSIKVAFMGFIDYRLDLEWLTYILKDNRIHLSLIGPISSMAIIDELKQFKNFMHIPPCYDKVLVEEMTRHDVLIMPYIPNLPGIRAVTAPNKLFQYLGAGRPVVVSGMENFMDFPSDFVYKANSKEEFLQKILISKYEDTVSARKRRILCAKENTWESRVEILRRHL